MGLVHAEIELINNNDLDRFKSKQIGEEEIRNFTVSALVDSGSLYPAINENIQEYLQLPFAGKKRLELANGTIQEFDLVGPLVIKYLDRNSAIRAILLPGNSEVLLGSIPMEEMDLIIDPCRQELIANPKYSEWTTRL
jgi:clan AA aspartic protease